MEGIACIPYALLANGKPIAKVATITAATNGLTIVITAVGIAMKGKSFILSPLKT